MDFADLAQECAPRVAHVTLAAIIRTESAFRPLAIGINGGAKLSRQPETKAEAVATAKWLIANGYNIDLGLGQVNIANLPKTGLTVEDAFDPCKNVAAAAAILQGSYQLAKSQVRDDQTALYAAISAYNTGSFSKGFSNGYVQKVIGNSVAATSKPGAKTLTPTLLPTGKSTPTFRPQAKRPSAKPMAEGVREADFGSAVTGDNHAMVYQ